MKEHDHIYTIMILNLEEKKMEEIKIEHCLICGQEKEILVS